MLKRAAICLLIAVAVVWLIETYGDPIGYTSVGMAVVLLICPGMIPLLFFRFIDDEHVAWTVTTLLTACYYALIWGAWRAVKRLRQ